MPIAIQDFFIMPAHTMPPLKTLALLLLGAPAALAGCNARQDAPPPAAPAAADVQPSPASPASPRPPASAAPATVAQTAQPYAPPPESADVPRHPVYEDYRPPLAQPKTIAVRWAPPPLLAEDPPPPPPPDAFWTGGYWVWRDGWAWAPGHWSVPPRPRYRWVPPYYEHRGDTVLFIDGYWSPPDAAFVPPPPGLSIAVMVAGASAIVGRAPVGPQGVFLPPPPGSRWGLIVPAPVGTPPVVVVRAPAIVESGMRVTNIERRDTVINRTTIVNNVTIEAPASATADHRDVHVSVPAQPHAAPAPTPAVPAPPPVARGPAPHAPPQGTVERSPGAPPANGIRPEGPRPGADSPKAEGRAGEHVDRPASTPPTPPTARPSPHEAPAPARPTEGGDPHAKSGEHPPAHPAAPPAPYQDAPRPQSAAKAPSPPKEHAAPPAHGPEEAAKKPAPPAAPKEAHEHPPAKPEHPAGAER